MKPVSITVKYADGTEIISAAPVFDFDEEIKLQIYSVLGTCERREAIIDDLERACLNYQTMSKFSDGSKMVAAQKYLESKVAEPLEKVDIAISNVINEDEDASFLLYRAMVDYGIAEPSEYLEQFLQSIRSFHSIAQSASTLFKNGRGRKVDYLGRYLTIRVICCFQKHNLPTNLTKTGQLTNIVSFCLEALGRPSGSAYDLVTAILPVVPPNMLMLPTKINEVLNLVTTRERKPGK